jgi:RNA recognition motif-containing protein
MGRKLYFGGLPYSVTEGQLQEIFAAHGTLESAKVITDKFAGRPRGFGFVEMSSGGEAQRAIQALNGTELDGRNLTVNEAKPMESRDGGRDRGSRSGGGRDRW